MVKYKKIRLYPTTFNLHVFLYADTLKQLQNSFNKAMPDNWDVYFSSIEADDVAFVESVTTQTQGKTIVMVIKDPTNSIIAHEIVHVLNHLSAYTGIEIGIKSQEWNAYFQGYLFDEISPMLKKQK